MPFISAIIVAAGKGTRMNMNINKQYIKIANKPILSHTISFFENCTIINEIILVVNNHDYNYCKDNIIIPYNFKKVSAIIPGGPTRQDSVYNGLLSVSKNCQFVAIHDGARPFINENMINSCVNAAIQHKASIVAVPVKDTIKSTDNSLFVTETLKRDTLWSIQTPQCFEYPLIIDAHKNAQLNNFIGTDDSSLVEKLNIYPKIVMGTYSNIKITTKEDLLFSEIILKSTIYS